MFLYQVTGFIDGKFFCAGFVVGHDDIIAETAPILRRRLLGAYLDSYMFDLTWKVVLVGVC